MTRRRVGKGGGEGGKRYLRETELEIETHTQRHTRNSQGERELASLLCWLPRLELEIAATTPIQHLHGHLERLNCAFTLTRVTSPAL